MQARYLDCFLPLGIDETSETECVYAEECGGTEQGDFEPSSIASSRPWTQPADQSYVSCSVGHEVLPIPVVDVSEALDSVAAHLRSEQTVSQSIQIDVYW